jgi:dienelactone hydrolase
MNTTTKSVWNRIMEWLRGTERALTAGPRVQAGVGVAIACLTLVAAVLIGGALRIGIHPILDPVIGTLLFMALFALLVLATSVAVRLALIVVALFSWRSFLVLAGLVGAVMVMSSLFFILLGPLSLVVVTLGAAAGGLARGGFSDASAVKRVVLVSLTVIAFAAVCVFVSRLASRGWDRHLVAFVPDPVEVEALAADDPSQSGDYPVRSLTYGSGTDKRRPDFGADVTLTTETVDATPFVKGSEGWQMNLRRWYWGFDFEHFPINGRVWYPEGEGPFPLVLVVHGNHSMEEHSDPGYAWLGVQLASRGFILVSVDENFFNGSWGSHLSRENDGRGWMLLRHLDVWRTWNDGDDTPFAGKVDLDRIALIGHSRGGEAAAIAASFNRLARYPDDGTVEIGGGFSIRSVVAIAPSDGQYTPADRPTPLENLSYLTIQGGHDADVSSFAGARQWRRLRFTEEGDFFKASVWSYRSNHGQFNTVWGDDDWGWPFTLLLNRKPLLTGDEQRRLGGVVIGAFLEATLHDRNEYRALFRDLRTASDWLPEEYYVTRYQDPGYTFLADFEEDIDLTTGATEGTTIDGVGLAVWREEFQSYRKEGSKRNGVVVLGWRHDEGGAEDEEPSSSPRYAITLADGSDADLNIESDTVFVFSVADTGDSPPLDEGDGEEDDGEDEDDTEDDESEADEEAEEEDADPEPVDFTIEVTMADGSVASVVLSSIRRLVPPLPSRFSKLPTEGWAWGRAWEPTLQTVEVPLSTFSEQILDFDPSSITGVALVFDQTPEGVVIVDDIGFAQR